MAQSENNKLAYSIMLLAGAVVVVGALWLYAQFYIQGQINTREQKRRDLEFWQTKQERRSTNYNYNDNDNYNY